MPQISTLQATTKGEAGRKFVQAVKHILSVPKEELAKREAAYQQERATKRASRKAKLTALVLLTLCCLCIQSVVAGDKPVFSTFSPTVEYPKLARMSRITGSGVYIVHINRAGKVTAVSVGASTGSPILDGAALRGLKLWKFKPGSPPMAKIPISWSLP